jgi:hypothetical protein
MVLQQIDTAVAFAMIMLLLSLVITAVVQLVVSVLGLRGRNLLWAVAHLVEAVDPSQKDHAAELAREVLSHPVVATSTNRLLWLVDRMLEALGGKRRFNDGKRPPTAVREEELVLLFDRLRSEPRLSSAAKTSLDSLFDPESAEPLKKFEAGIQTWFETVMDAASEKFKLWTRWITVVGALVLGFGFQVDSMEVFTHLSTDPALRTAVLEQAQDSGLAQLYSSAFNQTATNGPTGTKELEHAGEALDLVLDKVYKTRVLDLHPPTSWAELWKSLRKSPGGKLLTVLLLSLGAPFWYGTLKNLVGLRSVVARKSAERQSDAASAS